MELRDSTGRRVTYLRFSVTDKCNLRCEYCMPPEGVPRLSHTDVLRHEETLALAERFVRLFGVDKIRLTGGEPLVRRNMDFLVRGLSELEGLRDLSLTTNGTLLVEQARALYDAGLRRINVSLDSLDPVRYARITRGGDLAKVLRGLDAAREAGLRPIKVNVVLTPDFAEELVFLAWGQREGHEIRFIESMPFVMPEGGITESTLLKRIAERYQPIRTANPDPAAPGTRYALDGTDWFFEVIPARSHLYCGSCNRLRIRCDGTLERCLFEGEVLPLRPLIDAPEETFVREIVAFVQGKPAVRQEQPALAMSTIGG